MEQITIQQRIDDILNITLENHGTYIARERLIGIIKEAAEKAWNKSQDYRDFSRSKRLQLLDEYLSQYNTLSVGDKKEV